MNDFDALKLVQNIQEFLILMISENDLSSPLLFSIYIVSVTSSMHEEICICSMGLTPKERLSAFAIIIKIKIEMKVNILC